MQQQAINPTPPCGCSGTSNFFGSSPTASTATTPTLDGLIRRLFGLLDERKGLKVSVEVRLAPETYAYLGLGILVVWGLIYAITKATE